MYSLRDLYTRQSHVCHSESYRDGEVVEALEGLLNKERTIISPANGGIVCGNVVENPVP
jgi:hypothetical protein